MTGTIVVLLGLCIGLPTPPAPGGDGETLRLAPEAVAGPGRSVPLTGLDRSKMTDRSGWRATGERAREFALSTLTEHRLGDDRIPDTSGSPWLILIGPDPETGQVEGQLPDELKARIRVTRYRPDDPRLERGFKAHYPGGTYAIILNPDRSIAWKGLCELRGLILQIRRLLGLDPDPPPSDPFHPDPRPDDGGPNRMTLFVAWLVAEVGAWQTLALCYLAGALTGRKLLDRARALLGPAEAPSPPPAARPN